jgi:hypothetical protein
MPTGPKGQKRPADVIGNAVHVMKVLTGEIEDTIPTPESEGKNPAAVILGREGGKARAEGLSKKPPEVRASRINHKTHSIASHGHEADWQNRRSNSRTYQGVTVPFAQ